MEGILLFAMEHGSLSDLSASTFSLMDEDHTLANSVRFTLNQENMDSSVVDCMGCVLRHNFYAYDMLTVRPRVVFCGYSIPHPSDNKVNIRVQTTGTISSSLSDPAKDVLKDALENLTQMCQHVRSTFGKTVDDFKVKNQ
ncbi:hypothetical protein ZIOFF_052385 [Zingiber officinale]|uniref:DNA-directed RNA polymerase RBP11-like dimerisation domain-containing protein n=1 Tax=Zingiber officinale TaxID=94328 RepID=A0A8J5FNG0_ZINOF|nr:hypothetical protein ZIOFF_052385 [Zingiber officinale]